MSWLRGTVMGVVTAAWAASVAATFFLPGYEVPTQIHAPFMAVIGWLFIDQARQQRGGGSDGNRRETSERRRSGE